MAIPSPKLYRSGSANGNGYHQIKAKMRSLSGHHNNESGAYLSAFNQPQPPIADNSIEDTAHSNHHHAFISFSENSNPTRFGAGLQVSRPRVPDILMINKYYGLIPQKFTISSRNLPNSANGKNGSSRVVKTNSAKPRAKSSTHVNNHNHNHNRMSPARGKGCRSENDSPDPMKMVLGSRGGSMDLDQDLNLSLIHFDKSDPFGPVTKKMSVEKYKKWRSSGAGRNFRNLSLLNNELPENKSCHAKRRNSGGGMSAEAQLETRRVIKIDLNTVSSWDRDEENHYHHQQQHQPTKSNGLKLEVDLDMQTKNMARSQSRQEHHQQRQRNNLLYHDNEEKSICLVNNAINNDKEKEEVACPNEKDKMDGRASLSESLSEESKCILDIVDDKSDDKSSDLEFRKCDDDNGVGRRPMRAISLDESVSSGRSDSSSSTSKRRPTTASVSINSSVFRTPNNYNPPSKVIPWTQRESAGGKPLTLAERRAKFQRAPSIHSSSSLSVQSSMEVGEEDVISTSASATEEQESGSLRVPSVAFRESRKPLHVTQPPEIPTLISQNNPNADEDIQIEIEKVAIMLRKTQSLRHFSRSLDSGIEAESRGISDSTEDVRKSSFNICGNDATEKVLSKSGSESSLTSEDSSSTGGEGKDKLQSLSSSSSKTVTGTGPGQAKRSLCSSSTTNDKGKVTSATDGPIINRQVSENGSNSVKSSISSQSKSENKASDSAGAGARLRRPPLRKAVSISCEQELLRADAKRNEVNSSNVNENGKSLGFTSRPKTAQAQPQKNFYGTGPGTRSTHSNYSQTTRNNNNNVSQSHQLATGMSNNAGAGSGGSQGLRNRKILIKKALLEINQSSASLRKKWGTLGRPRTAPSSEKNAAQNKQHPSNNAEKRKPMKASPFPISAGVRMANSTSGNNKPGGGGGNSKSGSGEMLETRANSEAPEEHDQREYEEINSKKQQRSPFRQSFSLDEGALLGYSKRSVGEGRIPIFERMSEEGLDRIEVENGHPVSVSILNDEISFLSSKKREQCLKVYEKMMKTGCSIKLDTIFRGMLTPSEYRAFMRAAEKATQEEAEQEEENEELEREVILQS